MKEYRHLALAPIDRGRAFYYFSFLPRCYRKSAEKLLEAGTGKSVSLWNLEILSMCHCEFAWQGFLYHAKWKYEREINGTCFILLTLSWCWLRIYTECSWMWEKQSWRCCRNDHLWKCLERRWKSLVCRSAFKFKILRLRVLLSLTR